MPLLMNPCFPFFFQLTAMLQIVKIFTTFVFEYKKCSKHRYTGIEQNVTEIIQAIKNQNSEQSLKCNSSTGTFPWQQQDYMVVCYF